MASFLMSGEDRGRLRYVLVNRVRELQSYKPRLEELQDILSLQIELYYLFDEVWNDSRFGNVRICNVTCFNSGPDEDPYYFYEGPYADVTWHELNDFTRVRFFFNPGTFVVTNPSSRIPDLHERALDINQWILMIQAFFDEMSAKCTTASVALIRAFKKTDPVSQEVKDLWFNGDIEERCCFEAKLMLDDLRAKRDEWTLEIEGLRRELDHMGGKILALITDLSLNR